jgi:hypothetical protein
LRVFTGAINDMFVIMAGLCALGALGSLLLRSGAAPAAPSAPVPPAGPVSGPPLANGRVKNGRRLVATSNQMIIRDRRASKPEDG